MTRHLQHDTSRFLGSLPVHSVHSVHSVYEFSALRHCCTKSRQLLLGLPVCGLEASGASIEVQSSDSSDLF